MLFLTFLCLNFCSFLCIFYQWLLLKIYPISVWHGRWREGMYGVLPDCVAKMEDTIANARIIDESKVDKSKVQILSRVTLLNHNTGKEVIYTIVAEHEANLREGKLAIGTPIAKALLGHKKGDRVDVTVPAGTIHFEILDINI